MSTSYGIPRSVITTQPLCNFKATISDITRIVSVSTHAMYQFYLTQCMYDIIITICMTSHSLYVWHFMYYIWHHIHSLWPYTTLLMTSNPLYQTSNPLYLTWRPLCLCYHPHSTNDITATLCIISQPVYMWHPIHSIYDIISTMYDITTLCVVDTTLGIYMNSLAFQMTSYSVYHTKRQNLCCNIHFRHDITPTLPDIAPTLS